MTVITDAATYWKNYLAKARPDMLHKLLAVM